MRQKSSPVGRSRQRQQREERDGRKNGRRAGTMEKQEKKLRWRRESVLQGARGEDETEKTGLGRKEMTAVTSPLEG